MLCCFVDIKEVSNLCVYVVNRSPSLQLYWQQSKKRSVLLCQKAITQKTPKAPFTRGTLALSTGKSPFYLKKVKHCERRRNLRNQS
mmetsp:Transcript_24605/g.35295  ORF Transcript_24605/g.35295 Transcript_24605/m.35295 type:complete len:86 (+) Transcript_24605:1196-1453(+)